MENLSFLEMSVLVDLLASQTQRYTEILSEGGDQQEFETLRAGIAAIQQEIARRKHEFDDNVSTSLETPPDFTE